MKIIAAGERQVHPDIHGNRFVLFDGGIYAIPKGATTRRSGGEEWIDCEAHADLEDGKAYALIGGTQMEYVFTSASPIAKKGGGQAEPDDDKPKEESSMKMEALVSMIRNEVRRTFIKKT